MKGNPRGFIPLCRSKSRDDRDEGAGQYDANLRGRRSVLTERPIPGNLEAAKRHRPSRRPNRYARPVEHHHKHQQGVEGTGTQLCSCIGSPQGCSAGGCLGTNPKALKEASVGWNPRRRHRLLPPSTYPS